MTLSERAEKFALYYEKKEGRYPAIVSRKNKLNNKGYDIISKNNKGKIVRKIEVKGSKRDELGIPDCFETELTNDGKLVGTHLYLVHFVNKQKRLYVIYCNQKRF